MSRDIEASIPFRCSSCGCDFIDMAEPRTMTGWNGTGGSGVSWCHAHQSSCIRALKDKVAKLQADLAAARDAIRLCMPRHFSQEWHDIHDRDVDGWIRTARERRAAKEVAGG